MKKALLPLTILCFFICTGHGAATTCTINRNYNYYPNGLAIATGIVQDTGLNSIEIFDEDQKRTARFIDVGQVEQYHKGDYVRISYNPQSAIVATIKKMTVLEYKASGQNLGNIFRDNGRN